MSKYTWEKQDNGRWTLKNYAVFTVCSKGDEHYDEEFLKDDAEYTQLRQEFSGYCDPVHIRHTNKKGEPVIESRFARMGPRRVQKVPVNTTEKLGSVCDLYDISDDMKNRMEAGELGSRSVEINVDPTAEGKWKGKKFIRSLAILGSTKPFLKLPERSEPELANIHFSEHKPDGGQWITFGEFDQTYDNGAYPMNYQNKPGNPMSQNSTGQQPPMENNQSGEGQIMQMLHMIAAMLRQLVPGGGMGGMGVMQQPPQMGMQHMQEQPKAEEPKTEEPENEEEVKEAEAPKVVDDTKLSESSETMDEKVKFYAEKMKLEIERRKFEEEKQQQTQKISDAEFVDAKLSEGYIFERADALEAISAIGRDAWTNNVLSLLSPAPIEDRLGAGQNAYFSESKAVEPKADSDKFQELVNANNWTEDEIISARGHYDQAEKYFSEHKKYPFSGPVEDYVKFQVAQDARV